MHRCCLSAAYVVCLALLALAGYELTAKSPELLGHPLPGWSACVFAERHTAWNPPTGVTALDRLLHEGEEALLYYGLRRSPLPPPRAALSARSLDSSR